MSATRNAAAVGCALALAAALPAGASAASDQTITALGTGQAKVLPSNRHRNAAIKRAVKEAYARAVPRAIADARADAARIAASSGLTLGEVQSVDENVSAGSVYYGPFQNFAPFGPDQYCGKITRRVHRRDASGTLHTITRSRKECHVPPFASSTLAVTFAATPSG